MLNRPPSRPEARKEASKVRATERTEEAMTSSWRKRQLDKVATLVECSRLPSRRAGMFTTWVADVLRESCGAVADSGPGTVVITVSHTFENGGCAWSSFLSR